MAQINELHERGVFYLDWEKGRGDLWRGIAKRADNGTIQYSKAAASRISSFITISIWFNHISTSQDANAFADSLIRDDSTLPNIVQNAFKGRGMVGSGLETLISNSDELDDKQLRRRVKAELVKRLKATPRVVINEFNRKPSTKSTHENRLRRQ